MAKIILSTSNIMNGVPAIVRKPTVQKSSTELTSSLRANFLAAQQLAQYEQNLEQNGPRPQSNGQANTNGSGAAYRPLLSSWTSRDNKDVYVPAIDFTVSALAEERSQYDITVKLFYLPEICPSRRDTQTKEALSMVKQELGVSTIDLLIVSFPGVTFDADSEGQKINHTVGCGGFTSDVMTQEISTPEPEGLETMISTWRVLEDLHRQGVVGKLGVCEFGSQRLRELLKHTKVRPSVDQINVRDCCIVPKRLIDLAKEEEIELLTHNDCTDVLPRGTIRDLLGSGDKGAGLLVEKSAQIEDPDALRGEVIPQWVVKYTAVVKDRGVVENKGYFAVAELE